MVYITFYTELNLQSCNYAQKRRICREKANCRLTKIFLWPFVPSPKGCQLLPVSFNPDITTNLNEKIDFGISGNSDNSRATLFSDQLGVEALATNI